MLIAGCGGKAVQLSYSGILHINANDFGLFILVKYALATFMYRIVFLSFLFSHMVPPPKQHEILQLYSKGFKEGSFLLQKLHAYLPLPHRRNGGNKAQEILEESRKMSNILWLAVGLHSFVLPEQGELHANSWEIIASQKISPQSFPGASSS